jgi:hypothetical protein
LHTHIPLVPQPPAAETPLFVCLTLVRLRRHRVGARAVHRARRVLRRRVDGVYLERLPPRVHEVVVSVRGYDERPAVAYRLAEIHVLKHRLRAVEKACLFAERLYLFFADHLRMSVDKLECNIVFIGQKRNQFIVIIRLALTQIDNIMISDPSGSDSPFEAI